MRVWKSISCGSVPLRRHALEGRRLDDAIAQLERSESRRRKQLLQFW
jgi:hypothetical protein